METLTIALLVAVNGLLAPPSPKVASHQAAYSSFLISSPQPLTSMEQKAEQTVREFLTAVQKGDQAKFASSLHDNVEWLQPGNNKFSGPKKSKAEVFQMVGGMYEMSANTLALTAVDVMAVNGNRVACLLHWKGAQPPGDVLDVDNIDVYTVENGQITQATVYSADLAQEDRFWGK
ncbi:nuclear transport factor 2 family protein [Hymenobacter volaticus]|uniref:Nuclear transport factor 2 family protein n=1 Tax=Hymenobacter volaticus TaxID=2932254 RepID=A0ABY4G1L5_9BACT|nr:nuclear transport factor 2 family protein [Hymenobacter volaticus]UOQ64755.1 nuclear transport factor 2 family protein [Hymenobacter volaticus]